MGSTALHGEPIASLAIVHLLLSVNYRKNNNVIPHAGPLTHGALLGVPHFSSLQLIKALNTGCFPN